MTGAGVLSGTHVLTFVTASNHPQSDHMAKVLREVITENRSTGLTLDQLDVDLESERARALGVIQLPAILISTESIERGRLVGPQSHRAVLHMVLPEIYDEATAETELRRQLNSPGEQFPRRVLKRHERIGKTARVALLAAVPLFATLTKRQLAEVAAAADELVVEPETIVIRQGDPGDACFIVASGSLLVRRGTRPVATIGAGDVVGEMSLLDGGERTATVTASERCVLLVLDRPTFAATLQHSPALAIRMLEVLSTRLRRTDAKLTD
ncbi:MAG: cyclic nucleotide-binding domain-containing protein [Acidimicrobiia bacterium]|nr:cyclic nucleotide-binding domain-containing protein [Acidimicrobiia bacterium]